MENTPAPWHVTYYADVIVGKASSHYSVRHDGKTICRTINEIGTQVDFANMRLVAAAPRLLAVARDVLRVENKEFLSTEWLEAYNAVMAEAAEIIYTLTEMTKNVKEE